MQVTITNKSKKAFQAAAKKLKLSPKLPDLKWMRNDLALYLTAQYMLIVIIEAGKKGKVSDITDHSVRKYETVHRADNGYIPGSSGGGFSFFACDFGNGYSFVGARLSFNSWKEAEKNANDYPDLWEIIKLNVK